MSKKEIPGNIVIYYNIANNYMNITVFMVCSEDNFLIKSII